MQPMEHNQLPKYTESTFTAQYWEFEHFTIVS